MLYVVRSNVEHDRRRRCRRRPFSSLLSGEACSINDVSVVPAGSVPRDFRMFCVYGTSLWNQERERTREKRAARKRIIVDAPWVFRVMHN